MKFKLLVFTLFLLLGFVAYQTYSNFTPKSSRLLSTPIATPENQTISDIRCGELQSILAAVTSSLPKNIKYTVRTYNSEPNRTFMWRQDPTTPVFSYLGETSRTINLYSYSLADNNLLVQKQIIPKLEKIGFKMDKAQLNNPVWEGNNFYYGLDKGNFHYSINVSEFVSDMTQNDSGEILSQDPPPPENSSAVSIICGKNSDLVRSNIYDQINSVAHYSNKNIISLWENQDDVVSVSISELGSFGGYAQYWLLRGKEVRKIGEGQDTPPCEMFEKNRAGRGYACYDIKNSVTREVTY